MATTSDDPWSGLSPRHRSRGECEARWDGAARWGFYWMLDFEGQRLLGLRHSKGLAPEASCRSSRESGVELADFEEDVDILIFKLLDSAHEEIFHRFCLDIIATAAAWKTSDKPLRLQSIAHGAGITS